MQKSHAENAALIDFNATMWLFHSCKVKQQYLDTQLAAPYIKDRALSASPNTSLL